MLKIIFALLLIWSSASFTLNAGTGPSFPLAVNHLVPANSYQWAFSADPSYIASDSTYSSNLTIVKNPNGTFRIQANNGAVSFLAVNGQVKEGGWQDAFFGTHI
jgi:hypothetical protein